MNQWAKCNANYCRNKNDVKTVDCKLGKLATENLFDASVKSKWWENFYTLFRKNVVIHLK